MPHPIKPLRTMDSFSIDMVPNLLYRIRALKAVIGEMGDYLQDMQGTFSKDDQRVADIEAFLQHIIKEVNDLE